MSNECGSVSWVGEGRELIANYGTFLVSDIFFFSFHVSVIFAWEMARSKRFELRECVRLVWKAELIQNKLS